MKKLIMVISLVSIVSCATPTTPAFPEINCIPTDKLSDKQLSELSECKKDMDKCIVPRGTLLQILNNHQNKSTCLEAYKAAAGKYN